MTAAPTLYRSPAAVTVRQGEGSPRTRWIPRSTGAPPSSGHLAKRILAARGLTDPAKIDAFLEPSMRRLHDPSLIPGLEGAATRLLDAVHRGEPITIYGDYDVDGITATVILVRLLHAIDPTADVRWYIPHRLDEGYGLNAEAMRQIAASGARVVVSVDCGITAIEPARAAADAGLDLIITDHHNPPGPGDPLPPAHTLVHPRLPGSAYPFDGLCGAGVAFKLAWRLATMAAGSERVDGTMRTLLMDLLALASLGTIADVVPLLDENRVIARYGLGRCKHSPIVGLRALVEAAGLAGAEIDAEKVGFLLGPRLNACGRMGHAAEAVEMLLTDDAAHAAEIAENLCSLNSERQRTERRILDQASEMAEAAGMTGPGRRAIVLAHDDWHPGVVGIVCSRLVERFCRPAILLQRQPQDDGSVVCVGSGRSIDGFNLHGALAACSDHLLSFGGHDMAAGLRVDDRALDRFAEAFCEHASGELAEDDLTPAVRYDVEAELHELTPACVRAIDSMAPFGRGNPKPRIRVAGLRLISDPETFGSRGDHLSLKLESVQSGGRNAVRAVGWRQAGRAEALRAGMTLEAILVPKLNGWNGATRVEPELIDIRQQR